VYGRSAGGLLYHNLENDSRGDVLHWLRIQHLSINLLRSCGFGFKRQWWQRLNHTTRQLPKHLGPRHVHTSSGFVWIALYLWSSRKSTVRSDQGERPNSLPTTANISHPARNLTITGR
jgi:hypothetical protein